MMDYLFKEQDISIKDLALWDENARFPDEYFNKSEEELIDYFVSSEKSFKIKNLANAIVTDFDLPQLEKLIIYNYNDSLIVLEGNRRLTVYKLLVKPALTKNKNIREYFNKLKIDISINENYILNCLVTDNIEQGLRYIDRKHENGNYEVSWGDSERAHYKARRGRAKKDEILKIGLTKIVRGLDLPESLKENVLGKGYVTTFFRTLISQQAWHKFGYELDDKGNLNIKDKDFEDELKIIILNILNKQDFKGNKIDSRSLNKSEQIKSYLKSVKKEDIIKVNDEIKQNTNIDLFGNQSTSFGISKKSLPKSSTRKFLIPKTCILQIPETKINNIYRELKDDLLIDDSIKAVPNAVGVLFRVFLEISIDYFLEKEGINLKPDTKLSGKITKFTDYLEQKNIADSKQLNNIRKVATDKNNLLSINNFHDYIHSYKSQPSSSDLKLKWDNLQEIFETLWEYINNKMSKKKI